MVLHMLIKPLIYYDKKVLYSQKLEQEKYTHLSEILARIAKVNKIPIDEILRRSNEEIKPIREMEEDRNQTVVIFDVYVCEKNKGDIINYFIQGRHKNCCVIYISQSCYKTPKNIRRNRRDSSSGRASASCAVGQDGCRIDTWPRHTKDVMKMVPVATLLGAQHYKASIGFSSLTNHASLTSHN